MKKFILGAVAAVVIGLGLTAADASAHWQFRPVQRWSPRVGTYVLVQQRVWVPDTVVVASPPVVETAPIVTPAPVVVTPAPVVVAPPVRVVPPPIIIRPRPY